MEIAIFNENLIHFDFARISTGRVKERNQIFT